MRDASLKIRLFNILKIGGNNIKHLIIILIALFNIYNNGLNLSKQFNSLCNGEQDVVKSEGISCCYSLELVIGSDVDQRGLITCSPSK